jgi:uncharacterized membrane protein
VLRTQAYALGFAVVLGAFSAACEDGNAPAHDGSSSASSDSAEIRDVHTIYQSRCGSCHVRVELEAAFARHHTRVKMNDAEWSNMIDFLASDSAKAKAAPGTTSK